MSIDVSFFTISTNEVFNPGLGNFGTNSFTFIPEELVTRIITSEIECDCLKMELIELIIASLKI